MKKLSPSDWVKLSKEGLGLSDVITMAYVNERSMDFDIDESGNILTSQNHAVDAIRYSLQSMLSTPKGDKILKISNPHLDDDFIDKLRKEWKEVVDSRTNIWGTSIFGSSDASGRSNPVYNNTLNDFNKKTEPKYEYSITLYRKECECGAQKTYGKDCKPKFHSDWCPLK